MKNKIIKNYRTPFELYGPAVEYTHIDSEGRMWIGNGEYETQVNYCPFTGEPAPKQMELTDKTITYSGSGKTKTIKEYINEQDQSK